MKRSQERRQEFRTDNNGNCQVQEDNVKNFCEFKGFTGRETRINLGNN